MAAVRTMNRNVPKRRIGPGAIRVALMDLRTGVGEIERGDEEGVMRLRRPAAERQHRGSPRRLLRRRRRRRLPDGRPRRARHRHHRGARHRRLCARDRSAPADRRRRDAHRRRAEQQQPQQPSGKTGAPSDDMGKFVSRILGSADVQWKQIFEQAGQRYRPPTLVMFSGATRADACGMAQSAMGPFYCPPDKQDLSRHLVLPRHRAPLPRLRRRLAFVPVRAGLCDRA